MGYKPRTHYTQEQMVRAYLRDLVVDIRCARRDGQVEYGHGQVGQFRRVWAAWRGRGGDLRLNHGAISPRVLPRCWGPVSPRTESGTCPECGWANFQYGPDHAADGTRGYRCVLCQRVKPEK